MSLVRSLRIVRVFRVLRLARLLRGVKQLYKLRGRVGGWDGAPVQKTQGRSNGMCPL